MKATEDYPLLKDVYRKHAEGTVNRRLPHFAGMGAVAAIILLMSAIASDHSSPVTITAAVALLCAGIAIFFFRYGMRSFDANWEKNIQVFSTALNGPSILQRIEKELEHDALQYPHVVLTPNYMITFGAFGDIFCVRDIDLLDIDVLEPPSRARLWANTDFKFSCVAGPRCAFLSDNEDHIREIFREIRRRNPTVALSDNADAYFF